MKIKILGGEYMSIYKYISMDKYVQEISSLKVVINYFN